VGGKLATKPNTWKDFIACAEYLVKQGYTSHDHLAGTGTSAGGILIGRAITERPDLFRAAVLRVGVMNALRTEHEPGGPASSSRAPLSSPTRRCRRHPPPPRPRLLGRPTAAKENVS